MGKEGMKSLLLTILFMALSCSWLSSSVFAADNPPDKEDETMGHGSAEEIVVAKVNGKSINMAQLMGAMAEISRTKHGSQEVSPLLAEKIKQEATDKLIIEELALQKAQATIKTIPPGRLEEKVKAVRKKFKDDDTFQSYIKNKFGDMAGFKKQMERLLPLELYIEQEFDSKITVSDQDVQKAYEDGKKFFVADEFVQVNDLIFFFDPDAPDTKAKVETIQKTILDKYENDPTRLPQDGTFTLEKNKPLDKVINKDLYAAAKVLKEYGWTAPINVDGNLHIVQLIGYKPAINKSLKDVTAYLTQEVRKRRLQEMLDSWMAGLKKGADIEIIDLSR
jgi:hypothetical protein